MNQAVDQHINEYLDNLIKQHFNNDPRFNDLSEEQKTKEESSLRGKLHKAAVEELINKLNADQLNQIAGLDFTSPQMEAKLEEFAATIPDFLSILEERFQQELTKFRPTNPKES